MCKHMCNICINVCPLYMYSLALYIEREKRCQVPVTMTTSHVSKDCQYLHFET